MTLYHLVGFHIFLLSAVFSSHYSNNLSLPRTPKSLAGLVTWGTYKIISHLKHHCITLNYITIVILMLSVYHNLIYHNYEIQVITKQSSTHLKKQLTKYNLLLKKITKLNFTASEKNYILMIILMIIQWLKCSWASFNCKLNRLTHSYEYSKTTINNNTNSKLSNVKRLGKDPLPCSLTQIKSIPLNIWKVWSPPNFNNTFSFNDPYFCSRFCSFQIPQFC